MPNAFSCKEEHVKLSTSQLTRLRDRLDDAFDALPDHVQAVLRAHCPGIALLPECELLEGRVNAAWVEESGAVYFRGPLCAQLNAEELAALVAHEAAHVYLLTYDRKDWLDEAAVETLANSWGVR
jgi:Zn-dependent protease with chaperone function